MIKINNYTLSKEEEEILESALALYARVFQGQFSSIGNKFGVNNLNKIKDEVLSEIKTHLDEAQKALHGDCSTSWRITNNIVSRSALKAYRLELICQGNIDQAEEVLNLVGFNPINHDRFGSLE